MEPARRRTVFVVDDEEDILDTFKDVFEDEGFDVAVARDGAEGLAWLKSAAELPCIVILDLLMPVMDGNALYAQMQRDPDLARVPVVISTSDPSRAPPGVPTVRKPVHLATLIETVKRCR